MFSKKLVIIQILASAVFFVNTAAAAPLTFNVDGVISDSSDQPLTSASVTFTVQVKDAAETCLLYQETFPVSMTGSNGYFSLVVGKQTNGVSGGSTLDKVFSNSGAVIPGQSCTYTPTSKTETRKIIVSFDEGSGSQIFSSQEIQSVPYAVAAGEATKFTGSLSGDVTGSQTASVVGKIKGLPVDTTGIADGKILKYQSGSFVVSDDLQGTSGIVSLNGLTGGTQTFSAVDITGSVLAPAWVSSGSAHTLKIPMASGTSVTGGLISNSDFANFSTKITALTGDITASGSGTVNAVIGAGKVTSSHILDGTINGTDVDFTATNSATSDLVLKDSGTGKFATFACSTPNYVLTWTAAGWSCQAPATTGLPLSGGTMTGAINMGGNNLLNVGNLTMVSGGYLSLPNTAINGASAGQVWYDAGVIKYYDGSAVKTLNTGTSGMSNALSTGQIWVGNVSGGAEARSLNGDISSTSATGAVVVNKTTTGTANTILSLDGSSVGTMSGLALVNSGTVTMQASTASSTYSLKLPAASPTGTQIMQVDGFGNLTWIATPSFTMPSLNAGKVWIGNASNGFQAQSITGDATVDQTGNLVLSNTGTSGTYYKVTTDAKGRVTSGSALASGDVTTALGFTPVNRAGDNMSGDLNTQNINMAAGKFLGLGSGSTDGTVAGQMWYDSGVIKYFDGSVTKSLGVAGAGITSLNGLSGATQTFGVGTTGSDLNISSTGNGHVFNLPSASSSNRGALTSADWSTFNAKQGNALASGDLWVGNSSGGAQSRAISGDITIDNVGFTTLKNTGAAGNYYKVTTDAQGRVTSGSTSLGTADLPALNDGKIWIGNSSNGAVAYAMSGDATMSNVGLLTLKNTGTVGTYFKVTTDAQGRVTSGAALAAGDITTALGYTPANGSGSFINGGNTFLGNSTIGLNDAFNLGFKTNNVTQMTLTSGGSLGVGTATPGAYKTLIQGTPATNVLGVTDGTATAAIYIDNAAAASAPQVQFGTVGNHKLGFFTNNGASSLTISTTGKVGIGVDSPAYSLDFTGKTDSIRLPSGTTAQRAGAALGQIRFNTSLNAIEYSNNSSTWVSLGNALGYTPLNAAGDTMSGALAMGANDITNTGNIAMAANKYFGLSANSTNGTVAGQMWYDAGIIKYFDGSTTKSLGVAGAGITTLNGLSGVTQTFGVGTTGSDLNISSTGNGHIFNLPSASSSNRGALTSADWSTFNAKQSTVLGSGQVWVGNASGASEARVLSGDIAAVSPVGLVTVDKTTTGQANKLLSLDGSGVAQVRGLDVQTGTGKVTLQTAGAFTSYALTLPNTSGSANQVMSNDGVGNLTWITPLTSSSGFLNGGNTFSGNATIGLNDAYNLGFKTSAATRMTITAAGKVGIGTANPSGIFEVQGGTAAASTAGNAITLQAQDGGSGGASGGNINLTPGAGSSSWPGGSVVVSTTNGQSGAISATNNMTNSYTATSVSATSPSYVLKLANTYNTDSNTALINASVKNTSTNSQEGYMGFVSVTGAGNYSPDFVLGLQSGSIAYSERLRVQGSTGKVGIGTTTFGSNLLEVNGTVGATGANFSGTVTSTVASGSTAIAAGNGNIAMGTGGTSTAGGGQFYGAAFSQTGATIDFNKGNSQSTSFDCAGGSINLTNMQSGGSYTLFVTSTTTNKCTLQDNGTNITDTQFSPVNSVRTAGVSTVYKINKHGTNVYAQWSPVGTSVAAGFVNGGNTFAANASIGLNDAFNLNFMTNAAVRMTINSAGNIGIGTQAPSVSLDIASKTDAIRLPIGTTAQRPTAASGLFRYSSTNSKVEYSDGGTWYSLQNDLGYTPLNKAGDTMTGALDMGSTNIKSVNMIGIGTASPSYSIDMTGKTDAIRLPAGTTAQQPASAAGLLRYNTSNSNVEFNNGSSWTALSAAGAGITSLNGLTATSQTFGTPGTSGTAPGWSFAGSTHTLNIPMANTASVSAGLISKTEYDTFNAKQGNALPSGQLWVGNASGGAQAVGLTGDIVSVSSTGVVTVKTTTTGISNTILALNGSGVATTYGLDIKGATSGMVSLQTQAATSNYLLKLPSASPTGNQIMVSDASGNLSWATNPTLGYTPVNRAGDTMSGVLNHGGFDITNVGTITANNLYSPSTVSLNVNAGGSVTSSGAAGGNLNLIAQSATGFAGGSINLIPGTGSTKGSVTIGAVPDPNYLMVVGTASVANSSLFTGNSSTGAIGYFINNHTSGTAGQFVNSQSGAYARLGTGNNAAIFGSSGSSPGYVGIGTSSPTSKLHIVDNLGADPSGTFASSNTALTAYAGGSSTTDFSANLASVDVASGSSNISLISAITAKTTNAGGAGISTGYGINSQFLNSGTGAVSTAIGVSSTVKNTSSNTITSSYAGQFISNLNSAGTISNSYGGSFSSINQSNGSMGNAYGGNFVVSNLNTGTITNAMAGNFSVTNPSGTITTGYGVYIGNISATTKYALYSNDASANTVIMGNVGVGVVPSTKLDISSATSNTLRSVNTNSTFSAASFQNSGSGSQVFMAMNNDAVRLNGHISTALDSSTPTMAGCTGATLTGNDTRGSFQFGSTTTCTITFTKPFTNAPTCIIGLASDPGSTVRAWVSTTSATTMILAVNSSAAGLKVNYFCVE